jgi:hypothetical protein
VFQLEQGFTMNEKQAIEITQKYVESQFPKTCPNCGKIFSSLAEYLLNTTHLGDPVPYTGDVEDRTQRNPIGVASHVNCKCGTTLTISSKGMAQRTMWRLMLWASMESLKRRINISELLRHLRQEIDRRVIGEGKED